MPGMKGKEGNISKIFHSKNKTFNYFPLKRTTCTGYDFVFTHLKIFRNLSSCSLPDIQMCFKKPFMWLQIDLEYIITRVPFTQENGCVH